MKGIEDFVESLVKNIVDRDFEKKQIGIVSNELCIKFQKMAKEKENLTHEMKVQQDVYEAEMELKLLKEYGTRMNFYADLKNELWLEITKELGVPEEGSYSINRVTGIVSEKIRKDNGINSTDDTIREFKNKNQNKGKSN